MLQILISNLTCTRTLTFFSADVKRRRSLYDEDSLDGDRPYENEGTNVFKGIVQTIFLFFSLDSFSYFDDVNESSVFNTFTFIIFIVLTNNDSYYSFCTLYLVISCNFIRVRCTLFLRHHIYIILQCSKQNYFILHCTFCK